MAEIGPERAQLEAPAAAAEATPLTVARGATPAAVVPASSALELASAHGTRVWLLLGFGLVVVSAAAAGWEFLALQMPDSPFHLGVLSGPIAQLRNHSLAFAVGALLLGLIWPALYAPGEGRWVLAITLLSLTLVLAAMTYAASRGLVGAQLLDPRADARLTAWTRGLGHALLLLAATLLALRVFRKVR